MKARFTSATLLVAAAVIGMVYTLAVGNEPLLGLDLQGGVSVVLQPTEEVSEETLDQTVEIIRSRVDGLGVAEPEISRQGNNIVVDLPGVDEQQRALSLVGQTAELRFRPVILGPDRMALIGAGLGIDPSELDLSEIDLSELDDSDDAVDGADGNSTSGEGADGDGDGESTGADESSVEGDETSGAADDAADTDEEPVDAGDSDESDQPVRKRQTSDTDDASDDSDNTAPDTVENGEAEENGDAEEVDGALPDAEPSEPLAAPLLTPAQTASLEACGQGVVFEPEDDLADAYVVLRDETTGGIYCLGPTLLKGDALESAEPGFNNIQWTVNPVFRSGPDGIEAFNEIAAICAQPTLGTNGDICPAQGNSVRGALAIVLDHRVISAPTINNTSYDRDNIVISGSFDEDGARDLALALSYGALPVELEAQQTRTVSATIGGDVLKSGIIAGIIGLLLVAAYILSYYRLAGLVAISGLVISGLLLWTIIAYLGATQGLAITLAGVVGLIVSIGVSTDSNIVYFENVKDTVAGGKRVSTSIERAYQSAISTILKADTVSLIAAALLYFLTVGAVRGFALYLAIATFLDLLVSYLFMRPALAWLGGLEKVKNNPSLLGMPGASGQPTKVGQDKSTNSKKSASSDETLGDKA